MSNTLLTNDAKNRALRVFLVGLLIDLAVALALLAQEFFGTNADPDYRLLLASAIRTVVQTSAAYVLRRFVDPSRIPTPLPPEPGGEPNENV